MALYFQGFPMSALGHYFGISSMLRLIADGYVTVQSIQEM